MRSKNYLFFLALFLPVFLLQVGLESSPLTDGDALEHSARERDSYENSTILLANRDFFIPLLPFDPVNLAVLQVGDDEESTLYSSLKDCRECRLLRLPRNPNEEEMAAVSSQLSQIDAIVVGVTDIEREDSESLQSYLKELQRAYEKKVVLCVFSMPKKIKALRQFDGLILAPDSSKTAQEVVADVIVGRATPKGKWRFFSYGREQLVSI